MNGPQAGALVGLGMGLSILLVASWLGGRRRPALVDRIGPFVGITRPGRERPADLVGEVLAWLQRPGSRATTPDLDARLQRSGRPGGSSQYRLERAIWVAVGSAILPLALVLLSSGTAAVGAMGLLAVAGGSGGWWLCDARLSADVRRRQRAIEGQLPVLADLLALAVSSGTSPLVALERAAATMTGPLADEVATVAADVHGGSGVEVALHRLADRTGIASVLRFVDGIVIALERGTPLGDVLRAQAADVRAAHSRRLMELAGRKDVAMLVPVVFLVLPAVVLVAVFPGVQAMRLVVP